MNLGDLGRLVFRRHQLMGQKLKKAMSLAIRLPDNPGVFATAKTFSQQARISLLLATVIRRETTTLSEDVLDTYNDNNHDDHVKNRTDLSLSQDIIYGSISVSLYNEDYWNDTHTTSLGIGYNNTWHNVSYGINYLIR
ncbi:outer membrane usher protein [Salmonella bongori]|nr:outer membrane usher protein [Salmonella bongori]